MISPREPTTSSRTTLFCFGDGPVFLGALIVHEASSVAMTPQTPRILEGPSPVIAMNSLEEFSIRTNGTQADRIEALYRTGSADVVHAAGGEMFEAMKILKAANPQQYQPQNSAEYPRSSFGQHLRQIAQLIKAGVGLEIAFADIGGWDTHVNQGAAQGQVGRSGHSTTFGTPT